MKKVMMISCGIMLSAALFVACAKTPKPAEPVPETQVSVPETAAEPVALKLTVVAPEGWAPHKVNQAIMSKGMGTYQITEDSMPADSKTPDAYVEFVKTLFKKTLTDCKFGAVTSLAVSAAEARRFEYSGAVSGMVMKYSMLYVFKNGRAYTLTCGTLESDFAGLEGDFDKIIASAKLE